MFFTPVAYLKTAFDDLQQTSEMQIASYFAFLKQMCKWQAPQIVKPCFIKNQIFFPILKIFSSERKTLWFTVAFKIELGNDNSLVDCKNNFVGYDHQFLTDRVE